MKVVTMLLPSLACSLTRCGQQSCICTVVSIRFRLWHFWNLGHFGSNKQLRATSGVAPGIDINTFGNTMPPLPGSHGVRDPLLMVWLVQVLFLEVWAVLGQVFTNDKAFRLLP